MRNVKKLIALVLMFVVHLNAYSFSGGFGGCDVPTGFDNLLSLFMGDPSIDMARIINPKNIKDIKSKEERDKLFVQLIYCLAFAEEKEPFKRDAEEALDYAGRRIGLYESLYFKYCKAQLLSAFEKAEKYGITDTECLKQLKGGVLPLVQKGNYKKSKLVVYEIIPSAKCPELSNQMFNLALLSESEVFKRMDKINFAKHLKNDGLLSDHGLNEFLKSDEGSEN